MNTPVNREPAGRPLRTSDLAAAGSRPTARKQDKGMQPVRPETDQSIQTDQSNQADQSMQADRSEGVRAPQPADAATERLDPLFASDLAEDYRARWAAVQISFVDDPRRAVRQGDELVAQVMKSLAETFADERAGLESQLSQTGEASTETLRVALRRYRSFFERLLSL
ncbi:MAG: hypothetical protein JWO04_648 [Gammaproteobacteria bacterium]|jgi:hypothetical protein|nr:hypothetical protein [Gammaproteobacteria bacterium]